MRIAMFETCGSTVDIALQLHAATKVGAALLSEGFDLVAGSEKRGAGVLEQAVELGTAVAKLNYARQREDSVVSQFVSHG